MSVFYCNQYDVYLEIDDDLNISFNYINDFQFNNLDDYIKKLPAIDNNCIIVLWGAYHRIYPNSDAMITLNNFYQTIKNPLVLFTGVMGVTIPKNIDFYCQPIDMFRVVSKNFYSASVPINPNKSKKYLFMSTKDYLSRRYLLKHLLTEFKDQGIIAYKCLDRSLHDDGYGSHLGDIKNICASIDDQIPITGFEDGPINHIYKKIPTDVIEDSYLSIITETYFQGPLYFSEKIYCAMLYNHFFIYLGPAHSLKYLRQQGFKTFGHIIDESYDDIENSADRLFAVTRAMNNFLRLPLEQIRELYIENIDLITHNKSLVTNIEVMGVINSAIRIAKSNRS